MHLNTQASSQTRETRDVTYYPPTPPQSPTIGSTQKLLDQLLSSSKLSFSHMEALSGNHLHHLVAIHLSNGTRLVLKICPALSTLLLRHEQYLLRSEAAVYAILSKSTLPIPRVLKFERESIQLGAPFLLTSRLEGVSYADILPLLSNSEKEGIERQLRSMRAVINQYTSSKFGSIHSATSKIGGHQHWRNAFLSMMDSILMDGEDMMVNIPYFQVREALSRWETYLDEVTEARLVVIDFGKPENVLINRENNKVTGLLDFGMAVWGDPELALSSCKSDVRGLLYTCYHAVVTIVRNTYRAGNDIGELEARKRLTKVLAQLAVA